MKILAWIIVIWFGGSILYGMSNDNSFLTPFIVEYKYQLKEKPLVTIIVTVVVIFVFYNILF